MSQEHIRQAAVHVHSIARDSKPDDALSQGFAVAARTLSQDGDFRFGNSADERESTDRFVQAVSSVLRHRDVDAQIDFSEGSLDIARMTLAAWSFDRMVEDQMGRPVPDDHDRFLVPVAPVASGQEAEDLIVVVKDDVLLDRHVGDLFKAAVLSSASLPYDGDAGDRAQWEKDQLSAHRGDEMLGQPSIAHPGIRPLTGEAQDMVMDALIDARNERLELIETGGSASRDALRESAAARMPVPGKLEVQQEALLAVEAYLTKGLGRPLSPREDRMGERALDRVMESGPNPGPFDGVARQMLLDVSIQMQADRTIREGSFGRRSTGPVETFDQVISLSAGMDTHWVGISPAEGTTRDVAAGRYRETSDRAIGASILDGLSEASMKPFSKSVDTALAMHRSIARSGRNRVSHILDDGEKALMRGAGKGPKEADVAVLGSYVSKGGSER
jgi:hypothetical protein